MHILAAALLVPVVMGAVTAQSPRLELQNAPDRVQAIVHRAPAHGFVVLAIGVHEAAIRLPGGAILGVEPVALLAAVADARGEAHLSMPLRAEVARDTTVLVQAVALAPRLAMDEPGGIAVSAVCATRVQQK